MPRSEIKLSDRFSYGRLVRFVLPSVIMMVFTSIYGVVDGLFISNFVGKTAFAAVNLVMPFLMILGGMGFMVGAGGSALIGKTLGEGKDETANRYFSVLILFALLMGAVLSVIGAVFMKPIAVLLGASEEMLPACVTYGRVNMYFITAFILQNIFQGFLVVAEKPKLGLAITVASGVSNMVLDALLVGILPLGITGAALATGVSQLVGGVLPLFFFLTGRGGRLRLVRARPELYPILRACTNGASELMNNVSSSIVGMLYNLQLMKYCGENGVAAYGVLMYVNFIFVAIFIGYTIGSAPIVSYHFGAQNTEEMRSLRKKSTLLVSVTGVVMFFVAEAFSPIFSRIFVGYDAELLAITTTAFRCCSFGFILMGFNIFASSFFTALNNGLISGVISLFRTMVFQTSMVLILPTVLGLVGIWWSMPIAEFFACLFCIFFMIKLQKKYKY